MNEDSYASGLSSFMAKSYGYAALSIISMLVMAFYGSAHFPQLAHFGWKGSIVFLLLWIGATAITQWMAKYSAVLGVVGLIVIGAMGGFLCVGLFSVVSQKIILEALLATTVLFVSLVVVGFTTSMDLSRFGIILLVSLIAVIIVELLNIFIFRSGALELLISAVTIVIFSIYVMFDTQRLKDSYDPSLSSGQLNALAVWGAIELFNDFMNLLIRIIEILAALQGNDDD